MDPRVESLPVHCNLIKESRATVSFHVVNLRFRAGFDPFGSSIHRLILEAGPHNSHALYMRSVCLVITAFYGLRCHPLTCMLLKLRLSVDSSPT